MALRLPRVRPRYLAALAAIVIIAAAYLLMVNGRAISVNSATALEVSSRPVVFKIGSGEYAISLAGAQGNGTAYVYLGKIPTFENPLLNVTVLSSRATKANVSAEFANMELQLVSVGNGMAKVTVTPISESMQIAPDSAYVRTAVAARSSAGVPSTTVKTTVTTATTTAQSTTTVSAGNVTNQQVMAALQKSKFYPLMLNYSEMYSNTTHCTASIYNSLYIRVNGFAPSGPSTFENISQAVPYSLYMDILSDGNGTYSVVYSTRTRSAAFDKMVALTIRINTSTESLISSTTSGVFMDENYTRLSDGYTSAYRLGACGVYVV